MNPIQRPTQQIAQPFTKQKIDNLYLISKQVRSNNFEKALLLFQEYRQMKSESQQSDIVIMEIIYNEGLAYIYNNDQTNGLKILNQILLKAKQMLNKNKQTGSQFNLQPNQIVYLQQLIIRILLTIVSLGIRRQKDSYKQQLLGANQICQMLRERPECLKECFGRITGCQKIQNLKSISQQNIQSEKDLQKRAIMYGLASDWKYIIDQKDKSLSFKKKALTLWQKLNRLKQSRQLERQIKQFQKSKSLYINKMEVISRIVGLLINGLNYQSSSQIKQHYAAQKANISPVTMKVGLAVSLQNMQQIQYDEKQSKLANLSGSILKTKNLKEQKFKARYQAARQFNQQQIHHKKGPKSGYYQVISPILYNSKYLENKYIALRKTFVPFTKIVTQKKREYFLKLKKLTQKTK